MVIFFWFTCVKENHSYSLTLTRSLTEPTLNAGDSDNFPTVANDCADENRNAAENTLNSLESIDIYPFGGGGGGGGMFM